MYYLITYISQIAYDTIRNLYKMDRDFFSPSFLKSSILDNFHTWSKDREIDASSRPRNLIGIWQMKTVIYYGIISIQLF